ncbi:MAG: transposase, partial [Victivallales bacterium]|nr:transposase [Victivallales bacterium]
MKPLQQFYFNMQMFLFPAMEEEIGKLTAKMREFVMLVELLKPGRFIPDALLGGVLGRPRRSRERLLRAFLLKAVYNFPTTDMLVENLRTSPRLRRLCGWDFACEIPSRATFCRAFGEFAAAGLGERLHEAMVAENYKDKIVGHASHDSTEIDGRERACRRKAPKSPAKRKR